MADDERISQPARRLLDIEARMRAATSMTGLNEMYRLAREDISWLLERLRAAEGKNADLLSAASAANAPRAGGTSRRKRLKYGRKAP